MKRALLGGGILFCIILGGILIYQRLASDHSAPQIEFGAEIVYSDGMTNEELLADVTAIDPEEGDVSDSLVVESVTADIQGNTVIVVYAARDSKNNITKASRIISFSDNAAEEATEKETETEKKDHPDSTKKTVSVLPAGEAGAESEEVSEGETEEASEVETEYESETEEVAPGHPVIKLNANRAVIKKGDPFDPLIYISSIEDDYDNIYSLWRDIQLEGEYNTDKPGVYEFAYYVVDSSGNRSNTAHFKLTVKE